MFAYDVVFWGLYPVLAISICFYNSRSIVVGSVPRFLANFCGQRGCGYFFVLAMLFRFFYGAIRVQVRDYAWVSYFGVPKLGPCSYRVRFWQGHCYFGQEWVSLFGNFKRYMLVYGAFGCATGIFRVSPVEYYDRSRGFEFQRVLRCSFMAIEGAIIYFVSSSYVGVVL